MLNILSFSTQDLLFFSFFAAVTLGTILGFVFLYSKINQLSRKYLISFLKRRLLQLLVAFIALILVIFSIFLVVQYGEKRANDPIKVVSAAEFKRVESVEVAKLQKQKSMTEIFLTSTDLIVLDIRPIEEFYKGHLQGTVSVPYEDFKNGQKSTLNPPRRVAVFSDVGRISEAREVVDSLAKQKMPKIYLIKDGYDGLIKAGWRQSEHPCFECE